MRMYIGVDEFDAIIETNQARLNTPLKSDDFEDEKKEVPKVNKKSFLFGEINSILESRKPTEADKAKIEVEFGEYLTKRTNEHEDKEVIILTNEELKQQLNRVFTESNIAGKNN